MVMSSMGPALRMGSLRVEILKPSFVMDVSASPGATVSAGAPFGVDMVGRLGSWAARERGAVDEAGQSYLAGVGGLWRALELG